MKFLVRKLCAASIVALLAHVAAAETRPEQKVRLLIFGNSFSADSTSHLASLAQEGGKDLVFLNLIKGGCSLREHAAAVQAARTAPASPAAKFYKQGGNAPRLAPKGAKINALEAIAAGPWDYVSIHQYSLLSFKAESFEPSARDLVDFLRAQMPKSEIIIHESWAYREDDPLFKDGKFTSDQMHAALQANYRKMAADHRLQMVPIGDAFQAARKTPDWTYVRDPVFDFKNPVRGMLPRQTGSLHVGWIWKKPGVNTATPDTAQGSDPNAAKDPSVRLVLDAHHANVAGDYLGSCVWYEFLFKDDVTALTQYVPTGLSAEQAASLRKIAHESVAQQREVEAGYLR